MAKSRLIAALDIGSSKITTLVAQVGADEASADVKISIVGVATSESRGVKKGQIVDIDEAVESVIESVEAAERMAGYNLDRAYITVGGAHIKSQNSTGVVAISDPDGEISPSDVNRVIDSAKAISLPASREIIHVIPREYIVDGESGVRDPVGMSGVRLEVETHLVTSSAPALKNLSKTVNEVGISIDEAVFTGLAASYSTLSKTERELGCVLVDIGSGTTSIAAFVDGGLSYSTALPIGGRNVTNDLAIGLRVSLEKAESIKQQISENQANNRKDQIEIVEESTGENKKVSIRTLTEGIVKPRLHEIFSLIKDDLEKQGLLNKIPSGAIITGGGAQTIGVIETGKRILSLPTRVASPGGVTGLTDEILNPEFSAAVGLLIYASQQEETNSRVSLPQGPKLKLTDGKIFSKIVDTVKDLLP